MNKEAMKLALQEMKIGNYNSAAERLKAALDEPAQPQQEPTDSMGMPVSCGKPLCSPGDHHPLCKLAEQPAQQQEPVAIVAVDGIGQIQIGWIKKPQHNDKLYTSPPAQQEPVAVPTTSYEHRKFVLVGREWYERFAAFHDDCQIGEQLTWQEKTIRQQGYENGWNDAQRYLKEPQATSPTPAQRKPLTDEQWQSIADTLGCAITRGQKDTIETALGIKENT